MGIKPSHYRGNFFLRVCIQDTKRVNLLIILCRLFVLVIYEYKAEFFQYRMKLFSPFACQSLLLVTDLRRWGPAEFLYLIPLCVFPALLPVCFIFLLTLVKYLLLFPRAYIFKLIKKIGLSIRMRISDILNKKTFRI